jgi:hypothetical protein
VSELHEIPPEKAGQSGGPRVPVLDSGGRIKLLEGSYPHCTVGDPSLGFLMARGARTHQCRWEIVLAPERNRSMGYLLLDYGCLQRTLVFGLAQHRRLLHHIWLDGQLAIYSREGCPPALVHEIPRSGLETLLGHAVILELVERMTPN